MGPERVADAVPDVSAQPVVRGTAGYGAAAQHHRSQFHEAGARRPVAQFAV